MRRAIIVAIAYQSKSRLILLRVSRSLRPCDRLSSPPSVMLSHLRIRRNETSNSYCYSLPTEVQIDSVEIFNKPEALR